MRHSEREKTLFDAEKLLTELECYAQSLDNVQGAEKLRHAREYIWEQIADEQERIWIRASRKSATDYAEDCY